MSLAGRLILSLCDLTGNWSRPYEEAGYEVVRVDLRRGQDVRLMRHLGQPVHGILAAPPCTHFCRAAARLWARKDGATWAEALSVVDACLRAVAIYRPHWWALENPDGRLKDWLGPPAFRFDPCDFGDPWTKRTCLWGHFTPPTQLGCPSAAPVPRERVQVNRTEAIKANRSVERSATPPGFARAFFEANP